MPDLENKEQWLYHAIMVALATVLFFTIKFALDDFSQSMDKIESNVSQVRESVTRMEERQSSLADRFSGLAEDLDQQGDLIYNHRWRIRRLEELNGATPEGEQSTPGDAVPRRRK